MACKKDAPVDKLDVDSNKLTVIAQVNGGATRTSHTANDKGLALSWNESDKIGMYVTVGDEAYVSNAAYKADKGAAKTSFSPWRMV